MNASSIESRSLHIGKWGNLFMAASGVVTAYLSRSDAILIDGLFSGVNFVSAIIAAKVGAIVLLPHDCDHPSAMSVICFGLAAWHRSNWIKSGKQSDVLKIESKASLIDGCISAGAGAALMGG